MQEVEVVQGFRREILEAILTLEEKCFPKGWQFEDGEEYFREMLEDKECLNLLLKHESNIIGYALFIPHQYAVSEIGGSDEYMENRSDAFYLETIEILPDNRGKGGLKKLFGAALDEISKKGGKIISMHARKNNNFNLKMRKVLGKEPIVSRDISRWKFGGNEPYEYLEFKV